MSNLLPHEIALNKAKIALMARPDSAFFTTLCFSLIHRFSAEETETACTNDLEVIYNPGFFMSLSQDERVFLVLHETLHIAYLHSLRQETRTPDRWNIACDHAINLQLIERGFKMPSMGYADQAYAGMGAEQIYKLLPPESECGKPSMKDLKPAGGKDSKPGDKSPGDITKAVEDMLVRASVQSRVAGDKPGTIPGDIEIFLNALLKPKLPWNRILQRFLQTFNKNDYSFKRPNRRFFPKHHLPSLYSESLINLAIAVDTSGSVSDSDFLRFVTETYAILRMMRPEKITFIQFDTQIKSVNEIRDVNELMKTKFVGRGGTNVEPVVQWVNENRPQALLVFTDGEFHWVSQTCKTPVIWLIHNNAGFTAPYGQVIHYDMQESQ